jgi:hypothetical protein
MLLLRYRLAGSLAIAASFMLSACAQHGATLLPASPTGVAVPDRKPPQCSGQQNEKQYATLTGTLSTQGGSFCIPEYKGYGGKLNYPSLNPSITLTLSTSNQNWNDEPELGSGTAQFYLEFETSGKTQFGGNLKSGGGLTGKKIVAGKPYTAYGEASIEGYEVKFGPCYTTATKGRFGGVIGGIGALLKGEDIPFAVSGVIEIYSGQDTGTECSSL